MSKLYVFRDNTSLTFTTNPYPEEPGTERRLSRRTYLAFARWLKRNVQEEDLKPEIVRTFLNHIDRRYERVEMLRLIKKTKDEDLYRTLGLKRRSSGALSTRDQDFAFEIPVYYKEDFYHLLQIYGLSDEEAEDFTALAGSTYKNYMRNCPKDTRLSGISEELHTFAKQADHLPSRNWITWLFKHEYPRFQEEMARREKEKALGPMHRKKDTENDTIKTVSEETDSKKKDLEETK